MTLPTLSASAAANTACKASYTVVRGDTLSRIGARYGVSFSQIASANGIANPNRINVGQHLCIPGGNGGNTGSQPAQSIHSPSVSIGHGYYANYYPWGQCTWWAAQQRLDENLEGLGNAGQWAWNAPRHGLRTGYAPAAGATVVFQAGVQGAGGLGHVGHVVSVYGNGSFLISEMNYYANGGGFGRVSYRIAHTGSGVSFIY